MAPIITGRVPNHFVAGTTVKFTRQFDEFSPADGWAYTLYLNGLTQKFNKAAAVIDSGFQITLLPTDTAALLPGPYRYAERLSNSGTGEVYDIHGDELVINIEPNVGAAAAGAFNTWEEQTLAVVEAALAGRLTSGIQSYQIAGRMVSKIPLRDLLTIRGELKAAIWRQLNPGKLGVPYRVVFGDELGSQDIPPTWVDVGGFEST